jgi:hypothetical protein
MHKYDMEMDLLVKPLIDSVLDPSFESIVAVARLKGITASRDLWSLQEGIRVIRAERKLNRTEGSEP